MHATAFEVPRSSNHPFRGVALVRWCKIEWTGSVRAGSSRLERGRARVVGAARAQGRNDDTNGNAIANRSDLKWVRTPRSRGDRHGFRAGNYQTGDGSGVKRLGKGLSDVGRRRKTNQDAFIVDDELGLYVVADGMGGHKGGEVASQEAVDTIHDTVIRERAALDEVEPLLSENLWEPEVTPPVMFQALRSLESAVQAAAYMVFGLAQHDPDRQGMGTTISVLALRGRFALTAQVGDSRIYLSREGKAKQLTQDHTLINWQLKRGLITEEQARRSREKHIITRAVGSKEYVNVDTRFVQVQPGDSFLLCSDGLHAYVDETQIALFLKLKPEHAVQRFVGTANQRGGRDNITAVVVKLS